MFDTQTKQNKKEKKLMLSWLDERYHIHDGRMRNKKTNCDLGLYGIHTCAIAARCIF